MVDIHCHILPGVDDGVDTMGNSLIMARMAAASGVDSIVATPHCNLPYEQEKNYFTPRLRDKFLELIEAVERANIPVRIYPGVEVLTTPDIVELLRNKQILTINGSRYLLMEFFFRERKEYFNDMLEQVLDTGLTPIIAHPERYHIVQRDSTIVEEWFEKGIVIQLNKGSLLGQFGRTPKSTAEWILGNGLAHVVASDAHGAERRTPHMSEIHGRLEDLCGTEYADILLEGNPRRILADQPLITTPEAAG